ncbi:MAG: SHOCT domain-containing protein [Steroidobacteraceae bacterium]|nr:SHOCT domain-containing protein [Deltaproteobacteria bacterium]
MTVHIYENTIRFWFALVAVLMICAASNAVYAADARRNIWQSRDQFVAVERQDPAGDAPAVANDHPLELPLDRLAAILSSIKVRSAESEKPGSLFTEAAVQVLVPNLQKALQQASPGEDVVFAVIGLHKALYGLARSPRVTTGRIFYKSGKLNLIVGLVQQEINDRDDRRLSPFTPGSRQKASPGEWTLLTDTPLVRRDWMAFGEEWQAPDLPATVVEKKDAARQPVKRHEDLRKPAERLATLNELKEQGLITEDEYRVKRLEILNGI